MTRDDVQRELEAFEQDRTEEAAEAQRSPRRVWLVWSNARQKFLDAFRMSEDDATFEATMENRLAARYDQPADWSVWEYSRRRKAEP